MSVNAKVLKILRTSAGLDQAQLARLTGTTQQMISRMECGRVPVPTELLDAVAQAASRLSMLHSRQWSSNDRH